jgi:hypothetical protein
MMSAEMRGIAVRLGIVRQRTLHRQKAGMERGIGMTGGTNGSCAVEGRWGSRGAETAPVVVMAGDPGV